MKTGVIRPLFEHAEILGVPFRPLEWSVFLEFYFFRNFYLVQNNPTCLLLYLCVVRTFHG